MAWFFLVCLVFIPNLLNGVCADSAGDHVAIKAFVEKLDKTTIADSECLASWDTDNCCKWEKILCNTENRVVRMDLGNCNLSGVLVPQLGNLDNLTVMNLYTVLRGPIPPELSNLASLTYLALQENHFEGPIPQALAYLNNLKYLTLQENNLNGSVPQSLADKFPGMSQVNLTKNNGLSGLCTDKACCGTDTVC